MTLRIILEHMMVKKYHQELILIKKIIIIEYINNKMYCKLYLFFIIYKGIFLL